MYAKLAAAALVVSQATSVLAHGGVTAYTIGGVKYPGWEPYIGQPQQSTAGRTYPSYDPILSPTASTMACNNNGGTGNPNQKSLTIAAGQQITAHWTQWTHAEGPVTVYLAKCPGSTCDGFSSVGAKWFKIDEAGLISGTVGAGKWGNGEVLNTLKWTSTIPSCLAAGAYLIRHDLLALHQANTPQFYPECAQLIVTGGGGVVPSNTVSIPGAWSASDPGVNINIYADPAKSWTSYPVPGPAVWKCGGGGTTVPTTTAGPGTTTTRTTTTAVPTTTSGGTVPRYGQCGGIGYTGPTTCASPYTCVKTNDYYSQCV